MGYGVRVVGGCHEVVRIETSGEALLRRQLSRRRIGILSEAVVALTKRSGHHGRLSEVRRDGVVELDGGRLKARVLLFKVIVEYDEVIVLFDILGKSIEFLQEVTILYRRSVVCKLVRSHIFSCKHLLIEPSTVTSALHTLMHIKVEDAKWFNFSRCARPSLNEKIFVAVLDYSDASIVTILQDQYVPIARQLAQ